MTIRLYGYDASVYVRIVQLTLAEKGIGSEYIEVASFDGVEKYAESEGLHPFRRVPVFEHDGRRLHEARAIAEYIEEAFDGPPLMPVSAWERARVRQTISVYDNYCHGPWVQAIATERLFPRPEQPDHAIVSEAVDDAAHAARVVDALIADRVTSAEITLADLHLAPGLHYFAATPEGRDILASLPALSDWWDAISDRASTLRYLVLPRAT